MANGKKPAYEVFVSDKNGDKTYYHRVGAAWEVAKGGISIKLVPGIALTGDFVLFPPKEGE
jgi:hypothetical protein